MSKDLVLPAVFPQGDDSYISALNLDKNKVKHFLYDRIPKSDGTLVLQNFTPNNQELIKYLLNKYNKFYKN